MKIRIHAMMSSSYANGPGNRAVVWFQGCDLNCPGCFNPLTHDPLGGSITDTAELARKLTEKAVDGISISGGEPFQQKEALLDLLERLRPSGLPILVFSGFEEDVLRSDPVCAACLKLIDVLICGPYRRDLPPAFDHFCSSENQQLILLSDRCTAEDFRNLPTKEWTITEDGTLIRSGIE